MTEVINNFDVFLLYWVNSHHTRLLDYIMVFASGKLSWIVFYLFLLYLIVKKYNKRAVFGIVFIALAITLADQTSVHLFKNVFLRLRPCHQPDVMDHLRMITGCGGRYGFVSSHAANSFALVGFITPLFKKRWITVMMLFWALLVIYSRVYLGVHYPSDVLAGSAVGFLSGYLMVSLFFVTDRNFGHLLSKSANP